MPVCRRHDYTIYFEFIDDCMFVHCDVYRWSHAVAKNMKTDIHVLGGMYGGALYAVNEPTGCKKHQKFMRSMGFEFAMEIKFSDGMPCIVFKR